MQPAHTIDWPCTRCGRAVKADVHVPLSRQYCPHCKGPLIDPRLCGDRSPSRTGIARGRKDFLEQLGRNPLTTPNRIALDPAAHFDADAAARQSAMFQRGNRWLRKHHCPACARDSRRDLRDPSSGVSCTHCGAPGSRLPLLLARRTASTAHRGSVAPLPTFRLELPPRSIALLAAIPIGLICALLFITSRQPGNPPDSARLRSEALVRQNLQRRERTDAIRTVALRFIAASTPEEMAPFTKDAPQSACFIRNWISDGHSLPLQWEIRHASPVGGPPDDGPWNIAAVDRSGAVHTIPLVATQDGPKVDFHAMAGLGELSLADFLERKPSEPVFLRLKLWRDDYFNHAFADPKQWLAFRVIDPTLQSPLYAYGSTRNSGLASAAMVVPKANARQGTSKGGARSVHYLRPACAQWTVRARIPDPAHPDQMEITELVAESWGAPPPAVPTAREYR